MSSVDRVIAAFTHTGWAVHKQETVSGRRASNPTRVDLTRGKARLRLLVYAWNVTLEGKGRNRSNYRVQTTRSHTGHLLSEPGRLTIGVGIDESRQVIVVLDGWTKRVTGASSSVHIARSTLDEAQSEGYAIQRPLWDGRAATTIDEVDRILPWISRQQGLREIGFEPLTLDVDGDTAIVSADLWDSSPASWLRPGDRFYLTNRSFTSLQDTRIWTIRAVHLRQTNPGRRYPRWAVTFESVLHGRVHNEEKLLRDAAREANT